MPDSPVTAPTQAELGIAARNAAVVDALHPRLDAWFNTYRAPDGKRLYVTEVQEVLGRIVGAKARTPAKIEKWIEVIRLSAQTQAALLEINGK